MPQKRGHLILPPEIWSCVMQYCSPTELKRLAIVSRGCYNESEKYLYHTVTFDESHKTRLTVPGTQIRDLVSFLESVKSRSDRLAAVKNSSLLWRNGLQFSWDMPPPEVESHQLLSQLVQNTARTLSSSKELKTLHLSLPRLDSPVPFTIPWISSLTIPMTGSMHEVLDFTALLKLFHIPSLDEVELDSMVRLNCKIPENCRQPGTSNVRRLKFTDCGPVHEEVLHLLSWPKDLQVLQFSIAVPSGCNRYASGSGQISMISILNTLWPLRGTLQELHIEIGDYCGAMPDEPLQEKAFGSFMKLRRLHIPLELLMEFSDENYSPPPYEIAPDIHTRLPSVLRELTLDVDSDFPWFDWEEQSLPSKEAKELFAWLSGLAYNKSTLFPDLHLVHIQRNASWIKPTTHPHDYPLDSDHTRNFMDLMQSAGISMVFS